MYEGLCLIAIYEHNLKNCQKMLIKIFQVLSSICICNMFWYFSEYSYGPKSVSPLLLDYIRLGFLCMCILTIEANDKQWFNFTQN